MIQALDVDSAEPWLDGQDRQEDQAVSDLNMADLNAGQQARERRRLYS
jgi:hypothetical protein